jgi:hypothetical protein
VASARGRPVPIAAVVVLLLLGACAAPPPPGDAGRAPAHEASQPAGGASAAQSDDSPFSDALQVNKHAVVTTDMETYYVRNVRFNTGQGFGGSDALVGYFLNTRYEVKKRFIQQIRVVGRISPAEALAAPHRFDMVEDKDLDYTFRTELRKTDGETLDFVVRINQIGGELQEGGTFLLTGDELQTLRKIAFY